MEPRVTPFPGRSGRLQGLLQELEALPLEELPEALGLLETARLRLERRYLRGSEASEPRGEDQLLDVKQAAGRLSVSIDWLYRHKDLPFRVQVAPSQVRFSSRGIEKWIRTRKG